ncbi:uncharacterized protein BX663DRAFT_564440 [Cokeromyces recurvatus]|uniref:uncharacterized protein n=1 Tax=Cokeromyces recurvatus TaxID=90255 RepID=UPI00221F018E|nr:uncharacterized protein BX663DRAFT_564440 [Cokeromyces recurvatus]KAI7898794.1 hypothetical protein BX663DRAFT_564440 [Cokeromyces recurvatus]
MLQRILPVDCKEADVVLLQKITNSTDEYRCISSEDVEVFQLGDAMKNENLADVSLCGLDPNRHQVFAAAAYGEGDESHQIRQCSTKEYYTLTGSIRHAKRETKRMSRENMEDILLNIPTTKTVVLLNYLQYITYILLHLNRILAFNNFSTAESRFHLYQGVQRARQEMTNVLINGGKKNTIRPKEQTQRRRGRKERR